MPRGARLLVIAAVVAVGFVGVIMPLFRNSGVPHAEINGALPSTAAAGAQLRVDIAVDNVGDTIISPLCVAIGGDGATLVSANFQGLDQITASGNRVCGGQLTGQETISVTLVLILGRRGTTTVGLVPQQGTTVIGPTFSAVVRVT